MALASTARGTNTSNSSGTNNLTLAPSGNFAARSLPVFIVAYDNSGTNGADPLGTGGVTDSLGNVWTSRHATLRDPGAASAGTVLRIFTCAMQFPLTTGTTITFTTQTATVAKVCALWEVTAAAGQTPVYLATGTGAVNATTTPSVTTSSITVGDMVIGASANEYGTAQTLTTPDADSTNGTWGTNQYVEIGTTTSGQNLTTQTKVQTTANSTQTYNLTMGTSTDWAAGWISVDEVSATQTLTLGLLTSTSALYAPTVSFPAPLFTTRLTTLGYVAHYRMGEASGAVVDRSGTANNGTVNNDNGTVVRDVAGGLGNGQDDGAIGIRGFGRIDVAHNAVLNVGDSFSIGFGYKRGTGGGNSAGVYAKGVGATDIVIYFSSGDHLRLAESAAGASVVHIDSTITTTLNDNNWHFVVVTKSGATSKWYFDGGDVTQTGTNVTFADNSTAVIIGAYNDGTDRFNGDLDEFFISDTAFTAQNVTDLYDSWLNGAATGPATVTVPLLDGAPALYAPTLTPKNLLTLGLLDAAPALYAPSVSMTVTLGLLTSTSALYAPTVIIDQFVTLGLLDGAPALYAPTLTPTWLMSLGLLDAGPALYAPTLTPTNLLSLGLLDGVPALYAPAAIIDQFVTLGLLDAAPALYAPTVVGTAPTVALPLLTHGDFDPEDFDPLDFDVMAPALFALTVESIAGPIGVTLPLLDAGSALYAPAVQPDQFVTLGLLDGAPALYAPTVTPTNTLTLGLLDAAAALYAPTVTPKNLLTLGLLTSSSVLYAPTILPQPVGLTLGLLGAGPALYALTVTTKNTLTLGLLDAGPALFTPTLAAKSTLTLGLLTSTSALYAPTILPQPVAITVPLLTSASALYAPTIVAGPLGITVPLLDTAPALYAPSITATQIIVLGLLDGAPALFAPTLVPGPVGVTLGLIDATRALYAPTVGFALGLPLLTSTSALYPPVINPAAVALGLALLDAGAALYAIVVTQGAVPHAIAVRMFVSDSRVGVLATSSLDGTLVVDSRAPEVATAHAGATMVADDRSAP